MKVSRRQVAALVSIFVLTGAVLACSVTAAPATEGASMPTIVAGTLQALITPTSPAANEAPTSASAPTQSSGTQVSFSNVSLVIPLGLATGASSETVAATD